MVPGENEMTKIINIRVEYTGDKIACGPVDGEVVAEVVFESKKRGAYYVSASAMTEFFNVYVSKESLFEKLFHGMEGSLEECEKKQQDIHNIADNEYHSELGNYEQLEKSEYAKEMMIALSLCFSNTPEVETADINDSAIGMDITKIDAFFPRIYDNEDDSAEECLEIELKNGNVVKILSMRCDECKNDWVGGFSAEAVIEDKGKIWYLEATQDYDDTDNYQCEVNKRSVHKLMTFEEDGDIDALRKGGRIIEQSSNAVRSKYGKIFRMLINQIKYKKTFKIQG